MTSTTTTITEYTNADTIISILLCSVVQMVHTLCDSCTHPHYDGYGNDPHVEGLPECDYFMAIYPTGYSYQYYH